MWTPVIYLPPPGREKLLKLDLGMVHLKEKAPQVTCLILPTTFWLEQSGGSLHYPELLHTLSDCRQANPFHSQGLCPCKDNLKKSTHKGLVFCLDQDGQYVGECNSLRLHHTLYRNIPSCWPGTSKVAYSPIQLLPRKRQCPTVLWRLGKLLCKV